MLLLQRPGAFPVAAHDESFLVVPVRVEGVRIDAEEPAGIVTGAGYRGSRAGIDQRLDTLRVAAVPLPIPRRGDRVIDVVTVRPGVVAEVALIGAIVLLSLPGSLRHVVLDRQMVDVDDAANAELAGVVDHHVLNDLDAERVRFLDQILVGGVG